jgi:Snf7
MEVLIGNCYDRDINKVDATMDDIRDQMDIANEISDAISRPVLGDELDEVTFYSAKINTIVTHLLCI